MQLTNVHIAHPQFCGTTDTLTTSTLAKTGGGRRETRCPSAAVVKRGLSQCAEEQCVTRMEGGPARVGGEGGFHSQTVPVVPIG